MVPLRVLILEDSDDDARLLLDELRELGYAPDHRVVDTATGLDAALDEPPWDVILSDFSMPQFSGIDALELLRRRGFDVPFILVSGTIGEDRAVEAMRAGARDYVFKGGLKRLGAVIARELLEAKVRAERRSSDERFRALFHSSRDAILTAEPPTWAFTAANPAAVRMFAARGEHELCGVEPWRLSPELQPDGARSDVKTTEAIARALELGGASIELTFRRLDGEAFPATVLFTRVDVESGPILQTTLRDITELRRGEAAQSMLMLGISRSFDAIFVTDRDGKITSANPAFERLYGFAQADVIGLTPRILKAEVPGQDHEFHAKFWESLRRGEVVDRVITNRTKDGRLLAISSAVTPIPDARGEIVGYLAIQRDISEARRTQELLERTRRELRALIDTAPDGIFIHRGAEIVYANAKLASLLGCSDPAELVGLDAVEMVRPQDRETMRRRIAVPDHGGSTGSMEAELLPRVGPPVAVELSLSQPIEIDGEAAHITICRDVSQRNKIRMQLQLSDRMVSVGTLAAGVAHEINNPLAAAVMNVEMAGELVTELLEKASSESSGALRQCAEMLSDARGATERVREIVRDLRLFSRSDEERRGPVDVHRMLDATLRMAWNEIRHRARLTKDYHAVPLVDASEGRLGQVFLNLIMNAAQAIPEGSADSNEIRVVTRTDGAGRVVIEVRDTGAGMPPEVMSRLFTPFFTTKPIGQGTGLGLSICHRLVTAVGGEIHVESEPGRGSVFQVTLPAMARELPSSAPAPPRRPRPGPARRGRVLIIDDEVGIARAVQHLLGAEHDVVIAHSATAALEGIQRGERFDVILCDLMMPHVTGMEFHARLLGFAPDMARSVIFITGGAFTPSAREFLDVVANPRLEKPFDLQALRALVADGVNAAQDLEW